MDNGILKRVVYLDLEDVEKRERVFNSLMIPDEERDETLDERFVGWLDLLDR